MKKIGKFVKRNIIGFIIGGIVFGSIGVYAATIAASSVTFTSTTGSNLPSNTQGAIDKIYEKVNTKLCKRATTLHTEKCTNTETTGFCRKDGYSSNGTITYGRLGTGNTLTQGDAFDCDVNGDGTYNATNERFYYVTDLNSNIAVLIYYNNTTLGIPDNTSSSITAYDLSGENIYGPRTGIKNLPHTGQWRTRIYSNPRQIKTETGTTSTSGGDLPTFIYSATRLLTCQEIASACPNLTTSGGLKNCNYLMENTKYSSSGNGTHGYWLDSPTTSSSSTVWRVVVYGRNIGNNFDANNTSSSGVRPAIEVLKTDISF